MKQLELFPETQPELDKMWQHSCTVEMTVFWIGKNETCNWCGAWEEDSDVPLSLQDLTTRFV